jgi:general secretion pathway protein E
MSTEAEVRFARAIRQPYGCVLAVGPTGSGKTTTLYAALDLLNEDDRVLMTIEDPVEHQTPGINQIEVNPKSGLTFARGLRTILRADPDVILVGEIRDAETAEIAMQAAMTGHLVLTTLHAEGAFAALVRLRELGVPAAAIASSVRLVLSQRLLRRVCEVCSSPESARKERGCQACSFTGYRGRIAAYESLAMDDPLRIAVAADSNELVSSTASKPSVSLRQHALDLVATGITSDDEVLRVCGEASTR